MSDVIEERTRLDELREQCQAFHGAHPRVWELFDRFTRELIRLGCHRGAARNVWERLRWETIEAQTGESEFKLNNNHHPLYARRWMKMNPEYSVTGPAYVGEKHGFFITRVQPSEHQPATGLPPLGPKDFE